MNAPRDLNRHFWLTQGVARALGLSFSDLMSDGRLSADDYADLIADCCRCPHAEFCLQWLARHGAQASAPPSFCRNSGPLAALARAPRATAARRPAKPENPV